MSYVVVDLECTCWDKKDPNYSFHETIEIGAVFLDDSFKVQSSFQTFVLPTFNQMLSQYCTDLTTIVQDQIDDAPTFEEAIQLFEQWIHKHSKMPTSKITLVSWGNFDRGQLENDCERNQYPYPFGKHINLKQKFSEFLKKPKRRFGLGKAVRLCGLKFTGTPHRALSDAEMVAKIFQLMNSKQQSL